MGFVYRKTFCLNGAGGPVVMCEQKWGDKRRRVLRGFEPEGKRDNFWEAAADILLRLRIFNCACGYFLPVAVFLSTELTILGLILCKKIDLWFI